MSRKLKFANPALKKGSASSKKVEFNLVTQTNSFNAVFDLQKLDPEEERQLEEILESNWIPDNLSKKELTQNMTTLKAITSEIKSISRQGAFLIGERVVKAREMLKDYRNGTFTVWLESTFGSLRSGYNMLAYYELFTALPNEGLRTKYKTMPQKAAYSLANRRGDLSRKLQIIDQYFNLKSKDLLSIVQEEFSRGDRRSKKSVDSQVKVLLETTDQLVKKKQKLSKDNLDDIKYVISRLRETIKR
ncbi:CT583 family protein [Candidatus Neptunochlamydia vexilliferae]|uniref:Virulence plasmid protein pGP6-D-related protein n=1 Tax=Candidatus Neptunichlamydia vexilliferae TaxID=1651774 RepID=A0ABS0B174_9BACT|nr:CT583 family protein [Candidatus Neptunochlamydia vexilliferae]MBF5060121.1 Virulence plasmid protein pGP6-D-related protein [Candidatus Neptunochlamydia vexilliferae]